MSRVDPYKHSPVFGLPASLVKVEGKLIAALSLMQRRAGLNRQRKQRLDPIRHVARYVPAQFKAVANSRDQAVLTHYLDPVQRFNTFWFLMKRVASGEPFQGSIAYAVAIDIQLLDEFDENWMSLQLDEDLLSNSCPEWERLRQHVE